MYIHMYIFLPTSLIIYMYIHVDCLGCAVLLCLVCLFDLACLLLSFFLPSHLSFKKHVAPAYVLFAELSLFEEYCCLAPGTFRCNERH